jgi:hypothetical protein
MSFADSVRSTLCPYAGLAVWWQVDVDPEIVDRQGIAALEEVGVVVRERIAAGVPDIDMLAIELDHPSVIADLDTFTRAVALFMRGLLGPEGLPNESSGSEEEWIACVNGERLFVFTLGPFYAPSHLRHSGTASAFIVVQFLASFRKINMHRMSLAEKRQLSDKVKAIFTRAGVDYYAYITQGASEALKLVKPPRQGDRPIRWWRTL